MPNNLFPFMLGNTSDGFINNQDFVDVLFFFLAAMSLCNYAENQANPDLRNDEMINLILERLDAIEKQQQRIIDILENK